MNTNNTTLSGIGDWVRRYRQKLLLTIKIYNAMKGRFFILSDDGLLSRINGHIQYVSSRVKAVMFYITSQDGAIMFDDYRKAEMFKAQNRKLIGNGRIVEIY